MSEDRDRVAMVSDVNALRSDMKALEERVKQHFNAVAERIETHVKLIAEGHSHQAKVLDDHEMRLKAIEKRA